MPRLRASLILPAAIIVFMVAEAGVRLSGAVDIPLYRADAEYGYVPAQEQSGAFLRKNRWYYNELSMGVARRYASGGVLLVGDSIVNGGNQLDQPERLGPRLEALSGRRVWPISAGSWGLLNELAWLRVHRSLVEGSDQIVIVLNSADFSEPSVWRNSTQPERRPISATYYLFDRIVLERHRMPRPQPRSGRDWRSELAAFRRSTERPVLLVFYSRQNEVFSPPLNGLVTASDPRWRTATYRDAMHVDAAGTRLLAQIIAEALP